MTSPSKLKQSYTVSEDEDDEDVISTPSRTTNSMHPPPRHSRAQTEPPPSPTTRRLPTGTSNNTTSTSSKYSSLNNNNNKVTASLNPSLSSTAPRRSISSGFSQNDALSKLPPALLHNLRESFSVLDGSSNGSIDAESVNETLQSLGLHESDLSQFFPPGQPSQLSLPQYLTQLANLLVNLSPQQELLNAFSAFDDDDSGQIDIDDLKSAVLKTAPDAGVRPLSVREVERAMEGFTGRRILGKNVIGIAGVRGLNTPVPKRGGDVFRYQEFVANLTGGPPHAGEGTHAVQAR
ncbi:hypothetical protein B0A52_02618 [Exophiala mesophila]|uniref:EF-hand domain-containing protein n=1 Tax=Exophiala mesophila TaxID=212818 RepID=A0A438NDG5_EXOME|nr:hypothetical protein B0A52_02618 [Exophiala mesophila]